MACISKRRGKWVVDYRIGGRRFTPSFKTKGEAEVFLRELRLRKIDSMIGVPVLKGGSARCSDQRLFERGYFAKIRANL